MDTRRWLNQSQPQMLANATILLYLNAAFALFGMSGSPFPLLTLAGAAAGFGIANDKLWGWYLGIVVAVLPFSLTVAFVLGLFGNSAGLTFNLALSLLLQAVLVALLLHPTSRSYTRIWFK